MTSPVLLEVADRLAFWMPQRDTAAEVDYLDWGEVVPYSSADRPFRLRNLSTIYTASQITVRVSQLRPDAGVRQCHTQHLLSTDGRVFTAVIDVADLGPQGTSELLWCRRVVAADAPPGQGLFFLSARAGLWT